MVISPTLTVLIALNKTRAGKKVTKASVTVIPKIDPPNRKAKVGKMIKRLASNAAPVATKQAKLREKITERKVLRCWYKIDGKRM